jgi:hypothetical protein
VNANKAVAAAKPVTVSDPVAPAVTINSPIANSSVAGTISVSVASTDNVAVTKVEWYVDGVLMGQSSSGSAAFSWDTTSRADGSATLQARAYDAAGNVGVSTVVSVNVNNVIIADTTAPTVQIVTPANGAVITTKNAKVQVVAQDNVGVARVELYVDGNFYAASTTATTGFSWNHVPRGQHTLQAAAYDAAGNRGVSSYVTITR